MGDQRAGIVGAAGQVLERALVVGRAPAGRGVGDRADHRDLAPEQGERVEAGAVDGEDAEHDDAAEPAHRVDRGADRVGLAADAFGDHVDRVVRREFGEPAPAGFVLAENLDGAELAGALLLVRVAGEHDHARAHRLRGQLCGEPDRAAADHEHRLTRFELRFGEAVDGAGERLGQRGQLAVDPGRRGEDGRGGGAHLLGHAAVLRDADQPAGDLALVVAAGMAVPAVAAAQQRLDADHVALAQAVDARADGGDDAADLVPRRAPRLGRKITAVPMEIRAADARVDDVDDDLAPRRGGRGFVDHLQVAFRRPSRSLHVPPPRSSRQG